MLVFHITQTLIIFSVGSSSAGEQWPVVKQAHQTLKRTAEIVFSLEAAKRKKKRLVLDRKSTHHAGRLHRKPQQYSRILKMNLSAENMLLFITAFIERNDDVVKRSKALTCLWSWMLHCACQILWEIKVYFFLVQQRDTILAWCATRVFFPCTSRWCNKRKACRGKKSLPTCLSCLVKPEKTNRLPEYCERGQAEGSYSQQASWEMGFILI